MNHKHEKTICSSICIIIGCLLTIFYGILSCISYIYLTIDILTRDKDGPVLIPKIGSIFGIILALCCLGCIIAAILTIKNRHQKKYVIITGSILLIFYLVFLLPKIPPFRITLDPTWWMYALGCIGPLLILIGGIDICLNARQRDKGAVCICRHVDILNPIPLISDNTAFSEIEWRHRNEELAEILSGPLDIQSENLRKVLIDGINKQDVSIVESLFSEKTKKNIPNLSTYILNMFIYIHGNISDNKATDRVAIGEQIKTNFDIDNGVCTDHYNIKVGDESYAVNCVFYSGCSERPEKNGIFSLEIIPEKLMDTIENQHSMKNRQGIFLGYEIN